MIEIRRTGAGDPLASEVVVREAGGARRHHVKMNSDACERRATGARTPEGCVEAAFRFLLDPGPRESPPERFDVAVIYRCFPEFERELPSSTPQS